ncbi:cytochrome b [Curvibacter sp. RS43]|uniref:cytochrome b n=1 Tax=Curvibacter microcysteis TaxID=3026419 RepID=UPI00235EB8C2|nr:cytochrome b [Curvibacter sp. RS43]MDD0809115.1 cytochrome b [Curvibacter sp. RS43]
MTTPHLRRFAPPTLWLHWLMALLLTAVVLCIELHELWPKGDPTRALLKNWHFTLGLAVFALVWLRLLLRWAGPKSPAVAPPLKRWQANLSHTVQAGLYLLMIALPLLGWMALSASGKAPTLWGGWTLPLLLAPDKALADTLMDWHEAGATLGFWLVGLHTAAALVHHFVQRDNTLRRMLPGIH